MPLTQLLKERNMSCYKLSKMSGVPQSTLSDICTNKTKLEKCSSETVYRISYALNVPMESLVKLAIKKTESDERPTFELFRSHICHKIKDLGETQFLILVLSEDKIRDYYNKKWFPETLYLLAMVDYLSNKNDIPLCTSYDDIRNIKLREIMYPSSVTMLCKLKNTDTPKKDCLKKAIPEFLKYNIVECEVEDVC